MPRYDYECRDCGHVFEVRQSFHDEPLTDCPECEGSVRRVIAPVGIVFKGGGYYVTDTRGKEKGAAPAAAESSGNDSGGEAKPGTSEGAAGDSSAGTATSDAKGSGSESNAGDKGATPESKASSSGSETASSSGE